MLRFLHTYTEQTWEGMVKQGLLRPGDGLKLMHKVHFPKEKSFNVIGMPGKPLYETVKALGGPFYIDRLQGGVSLPWLYTYDPALLEEYRKMLGANFWGFQMHEWATNYLSETERIAQVFAKWKREQTRDVTLTDFWLAVRGNFREKLGDGTEHPEIPMLLYEESWTPDEYLSGTVPPPPKTLDAYLSACRKLYTMRSRAQGPIFPADSYGLAARLEYEMGAKRFMPEVGWQIGGTRIQIAYTRGKARAYGLPFGIYYENWCSFPPCEGAGEKMSVAYAADTTENEWLEYDLRDSILKDGTQEQMENGGSSLSLMARLFRYAWFSGADAIGEEYGICNTFYDYHDFALSKYGREKKRFLDFEAAHPVPGTPFVPFAIILPREMPILDMRHLYGSDVYLGFPTTGAKDNPYARAVLSDAFTEKLDTVRRVLNLFFTGAETRLGNEAHVLANTAYPDVFDILDETDTAAMERYPYLIDLTGNPAFSENRKNCVSPEDVLPLLRRLLPFWTEGVAHTAYNRTDGGWQVLVINNNGVLRTHFAGDRFLPEADLTERLRFSGEVPQLRVLDGAGTCTGTDDGYTLSLGAGQWLLLAF